jgi:dipeptidyl aminopeptidase/acylaminoacyl peptidase
MCRHLLLSTVLAVFAAVGLGQAQKPLVTLDEFFNAVDIRDVRIAPDGGAVVIETSRADWGANRFRSDLWLYRGEGGGSLVPLTTTGHDRDAQWSPDGRWIAFLSDRDTAEEAAKDKAEKPVQVFVIPVSGGEAFAVTRGEEEVHAFAWSGDSREIYFATRTHWSKEQQEAYKKEWNDVVQFRESERGDVIGRIGVGDAIRCASATADRPCDASTGVKQIAAIPLRVKQMETSPDGSRLAVLTESRTERWESPADYEIDLVAAAGGPVKKLMARPAIVDSLRWAPDSRRIFFSFLNGAVEGPYQDAQPRVYSVDAETGSMARWAAAFPGAITGYSPLPDGGLLATGRIGTEVQA